MWRPEVKVSEAHSLAGIRSIHCRVLLLCHSAGNVREVIWYENVYVYVNSSGHVYWKIRSDYSVTCGLDMTYFPFDTQICNIDVATQELSTFDANLTNGKPNLRFCIKFSKKLILHVHLCKERNCTGNKLICNRVQRQ